MENFEQKHDLIKIGELSEKVGLPVPTLRHYTKLGLLKVSAYTDGGQYLYDAEKTLEDLKYIDELSHRGMKLNEISEKICGGNTIKKIIIIDDDAQTSAMLKDMIKRFYPKWEIQISTNVFDAGYILAKFLPDLVILDICLPAVEGYEICKYIKSNIMLKHTKIVSISGDDNPSTKEKILKDGADSFVTKPVNFNNFLPLIKRVLNL